MALAVLACACASACEEVPCVTDGELTVAAGTGTGGVAAMECTGRAIDAGGVDRVGIAIACGAGRIVAYAYCGTEVAHGEKTGNDTGAAE